MADAIAGREMRVGPIPVIEHAAQAPQPPNPPPIAAPLPVSTAPVGSLKDIGRTAAREAERELIYRTLQQTRWNRREAAEILGISYKALLYKIKEAELDKAS
jgi:DNA-binding NtrC family response regulator